MTPQKFIEVFDTVAEAPGGIERLREMVLQLAVRGRLVPQGEEDGPASKLLAEFEKGKERLLGEKVISKSRYPCGVPVNKEPFKVPSTWLWLRLGDVGAIVGGGTPKSAESSFWSDGQDVPWLTPADMRRQSSRYIARGERDITSEGLGRSSAQMLPAGSVLFSSRAPIGHVGIAANPLSTNQGFKSCVPYLPAMSDYLYVYLKHAGPSINDQATGTTFKEVAGREFALVPLPVPPLAEQQRIVAKFDELIGLIGQLEAARYSRESVRTAARDSALAALCHGATPEEVRTAWARITERMDDLFTAPDDLTPLREAVLQLAVRGRLVSQNSDDESAALLLEHIAEERARLVRAKKISKQKPVPDLDHSATAVELPSGWIWTCTAALGVVNPRNVAEDDAIVSFCPMLVIPTDYRQSIVPETRRWGEIKKGYTHFADGDVVVAKITPCFQNRKSCVMIGLEGGIGAGTTELHVIRIIANNVVPEYLLLFYKSPSFLQMGIATMTGTAGQQRVPREYFAYTPIPLPPLAEQHRIVAKVDELMRLIDRLEGCVSAREEYHESLAVAVDPHSEEAGSDIDLKVA